MAKAKKRVASRKKSSKRRKARAKPTRKTAAKRTKPKQAKSKVRRAGSGAPKPAVKKKRPPKTAARKAPRKAPRKVVEAPVVEDTIIDVIDEPVPGVVVVTEYESIRTGTPISPGREPKRSESGSLAIFKTLRTHDWANSPHPSSDARYCRQLSG